MQQGGRQVLVLALCLVMRVRHGLGDAVDDALKELVILADALELVVVG